jgi:transposase
MYTSQDHPEHRVGTDHGPARLRIHWLGPHPIINHFLARMTLSRIVRSCLGSRQESLLDHAQTLTCLLHNILLSPGPLYRIADWVAPIEPRALELGDSEKAALNDDRVARTLDVLATERSRSLFFRLALHLIRDFELDVRRIHQDTTTVTFTGQYRSSRRTPQITQGINKDHRPDLKQLVFGVSVTADGAVPLLHEVHSGNRTDDTLHRSNLDRLREILGTGAFIYVADCKLCTTKNLEHIVGHNGWFVTVMPRTRVEDREFRQHLRRAAVRWRRLYVQPNGRRQSDPPDVYESTAEGAQITKEGYRLVWIRSSQKAAADAESRQRALAAAGVELVDLGARLNRGRWRRRGSILKSAQAILKQHGCEGLLRIVLHTETRVRVRHLRPGRPGRGDPVREERRSWYRLEFEPDTDSLQAQARTDGVFPLITNLPARPYTKKEVLLIYKYQPYVEKRHALLKSELEVAPVYLKRPPRIVGLVHAHFLAMVLEALIERTVRLAMRREGIESLPILPEGRLTKTPTAPRILEKFTGVSWYEFERGDETITFPIELTSLQKQLLNLLGMDPRAYD